MIETFVKGDSIDFNCEVKDEEDVIIDITDYKIRFEMWDDDNTLKKATTNSGGSDSQILITEPENGKFIIYIDKNETAEFSITPQIEVEIENAQGKKYTVLQDTIKLEDQRITWETP